MNAILKNLYEKELEFKNQKFSIENTVINNQKINELEIEKNRIYFQIEKNHNLRIDYTLQLFKNIRVPCNILKESSANGMCGNIKDFDRDHINSFFLDKFNIDVTAVDIFRIPTMPAGAEAYAIPCGIDEHYIVIPTKESDLFLSYDLLIHELGHTVEYTSRRKKLDPAYIFGHPLLSETIAHYYQMIYMLKHSTREERLSMLCSTTESYVFNRCMQIMQDIEPKNPKFDFTKIIRHKDFDELEFAYQSTSVLQNFINRYDKKEFAPISYDQHAKRLGVFLALNFIKYKFDIKELFDIKLPKGRADLSKLIAQTNLKANKLFDFSKIDETLNSFVNGALSNNC